MGTQVDPTIEVPPARLLPARPTRTAPYIYTSAQIAALLDAAARLRPAIRSATHHTLIALMATTGIRTGKRSDSTSPTWTGRRAP